MYRIVLIIGFLGIFCHYASAENFPTGSRSAGMGNASVTLTDGWSVYHNQAGLARLEKPWIGFHHENRFIIPEYGLQSIGAAIPGKYGTFGIQISYFGYSQYNESIIGLAYAKALGEKVSLGVRLDYFNMFIADNYGNRGTVIGEVGILAQPFENFFVGAHLFNPTQSSVAEYDNERVPTIIRIGIGYKFSDKLYVAAETEKDMEMNPVFKAGIDFMIIENLFLRTGISTNPTQNTFGLGYKLKRFRADIAFSTHQVVGLTPHFSLSYEFK